MTENYLSRRINGTLSAVRLPVVLAVVYMLFMVSTAWWLSRQQAYLNYDSLRHYLVTAHIVQDIKTSGWTTVLCRLPDYMERHPPGIYLVNAVVMSLFDLSQKGTILFNTGLFVAILLFAVYRIGRAVYTPAAGVLAGIVVLLYPVVFGQSRIFMLDLPLTATNALAFCCLVSSEGFVRRRWTVAFILASLAGLMIKSNFVLFIIGPAVYIFVRRLRKHPQAVPLLFLSVGILAAMGMLYYHCVPGYNKQIIDWALQLRGGGVIHTWVDPALSSVPFWIHKVRALAWYLWGFINWQAGLPAFLVFVWGVRQCCRRQESFPLRLTMIWLLCGYVLLSWFGYAIDMDMEVTGIRYSLPLLVPVALISAGGLIRIRRIILRRTVIAAVLAVAIFQGVSVSIPGLPHVQYDIPLVQDRYHILPRYLSVFRTQPYIISGSNWRTVYEDRSRLYGEIEAVFEYIVQQAAQRTFSRPLSVLLGADNPDWWHLRYLSQKYSAPVRFYCDYARSFIPVSAKDPAAAMARFIREQDYLLGLKNPFVEPYMRQWYDRMHRAAKQELPGFTPVGEGEFFVLLKNTRIAQPESLLMPGRQGDDHPLTAPGSDGEKENGLE